MRKLTIKRTKSVVASLLKVKVYIEDHVEHELMINKVPCRKLGELKNGEEKIFQIGEQGAKIFVIGDKLSKDYCSEMYQLSDGQNDVYLSGKTLWNPLAGNPFRFDNNEGVEVMENRKKGTRKGIAILCVSILVGFVAGIFIGCNQEAQPKTFSAQGMSITLTDEFREFDAENFTVGYETGDVVVLGLKEEFSLMEGAEDYTLEEYGNLVLQSNGMDDFQLDTVEGVTFFEYLYTDPDTNENYQYFSCVYKANDAFWLMQFVTLEENVDIYAEQFLAWAKSVEFAS